MRFFPRRSACLAAVFGIAFQAVVWAAPASSLSGVRFHSGSEHDRIVFDWNAMPGYQVNSSDDGKCITLTFRGLPGKGWKKPEISGALVKKVSYEEKNGRFLVKIFLNRPLKYKVDKVSSPARVFVDVLPDKQEPVKPQTQDKPGTTVLRGSGEPKGTAGPTRDFTEIQLAPGLKKTIYSRWDSDGPVKAFFIEADKSRYRIKPALDGNQVIGRESVSRISDEQDAVAAVNASYFAWNGDILGDLKIDGTVVGTTYMERTAMGIKDDGSVIFGRPNYSGLVTLGSRSWPVGGVNAERGADSLVLYNHWYGPSTRTNEYGLEFVVKNGKVVDIRTGNTPIPSNGVVVSVHGTAMAAFQGIRVGDAADIQEDMGNEWNRVNQVIGAGPRLLANGKIQVTAGEEKFPSDIRYGRAPRSAFGVTKDGNYVLAVVDGRQSQSHGCTLTEWAELLKQYGCVNALNFDGGGSSALVIGGKLQNSPSDGEERSVGSALVILEK